VCFDLVEIQIEGGLFSCSLGRDTIHRWGWEGFVFFVTLQFCQIPFCVVAHALRPSLYLSCYCVVVLGNVFDACEAAEGAALLRPSCHVVSPSYRLVRSEACWCKVRYPCIDVRNSRNLVCSPVATTYFRWALMGNSGIMRRITFDSKS